MATTSAVDRLLAAAGGSIRDALAVIDRNGLGIAFLIDDDVRLRGVVTDGDIRRALLGGASPSDPVTVAAPTAFVTLPVTASSETIRSRLTGSVRVIPLLDDVGRPVDFASQYRNHRFPIMEPSLTGNEVEYVMECLKTSWISSQGPFVKKFEADFAKYVGVDEAIAVSNGTVALHLALEAFGIGPGDEVIVPDLTFAASINAVLYTRATPVLADVSRSTWTLEIADVERLITKRTKAIMPVHLYGQPAEMQEIMELARQHNLYVIEDTAEGLGALYRGRQAGSIGHAATFSFFGNKLITTGEGGMVTFQDPSVASRARRLRDHGMDPNRRYWHTEVGYNYRLTNLQAAIGTAQLEQIDRFIAAKLRMADTYRQQLQDIDGIVFAAERPEVRNIYWLVSIILDLSSSGLTRDELMDRLLLNGVETRRMFFPLHVMPPYQQYAGGRSFPNSDWLSANGLSLPSAVTLDTAQITHVCDVIRRVLDARQLQQMAAAQMAV